MKSWLDWTKSVLLDRYVGSIVIAMSLVYGITTLVQMIMQPIAIAITTDRQRSVLMGPFGDSGKHYPDFSFYAGEIIRAGLFIFIAFLLARWLFGRPVASEDENERAEGEQELA